MGKSKSLEELFTLIKEKRSKESSFEEIYKQLIAETTNSERKESYQQKLREIDNKSASTYKKARELTDAAWPEFENFVSEFEKAVMAAMHDG